MSEKHGKVGNSIVRGIVDEDKSMARHDAVAVVHEQTHGRVVGKPS